MGPGSPVRADEFFAHLKQALGGLPLLAEDLGMITKDVLKLRDQFHLPGMRVLQFAFDGDPQNTFLPQNYVHNTVVYTGTHDNDTTRGWYADLPAEARAGVARLLQRADVRGGGGGLGDDPRGACVGRGAWSSCRCRTC